MRNRPFRFEIPMILTIEMLAQSRAHANIAANEILTAIDVPRHLIGSMSPLGSGGLYSRDHTARIDPLFDKPIRVASPRDLGPEDLRLVLCYEARS